MDYDYDELFPGRFMKAGEFKGRDVTLKIANVEIEELPDKKGTKKNKEGVLVRVRGIVTFERTDKALVLNRTNGECLRILFGRRTGAWTGKRVTLYPATVEAFGEETQAIRVRGSPDIERDIRGDLKLGQKTRSVTLKRTGQQANGKQQAAPAAPPPSEPAAGDEEPPDDLPSGDDVVFPDEEAPQSP